MPEQKSQSQQQAQETQAQPVKKEAVVSKTTLMIVGVFLVLNMAMVGFFFYSKSAGQKEEEKVAVEVSPLDKIAPIELGRLDITKAIDPIQQNFMRCSLTVTLIVPAEKLEEVEPKVKKFEATFKEIARKAFLDADPRDVSTENLAGVKNAIKTRSNELLGEEAVLEVVFGDFRPY
jgi:flagellar basal body-associated protein FliL